jgi:serine-aspartate repeat-containing protein C/D/E
VVRMTFEYTGEGCAASNHHQSPESATCSGDAAMSEPVRILITNGAGAKVYADVSNIYLGGTIVADSANVNEDRLDPHVWIRIYDAADALLEESEFHASCSQPLNVGDQFGSMLVVAMTTTLGGEVTIGDLVSCITNIPGTLPGADVEYTYVITNDGGVTLTNVTVIDDVFGEVPGSPIASIGPGESVTLTLTVFVSGETTNTVTVHAQVGDVECAAMATTTITVGLADCDSDGDTDLDDLEKFVGCLTGPGGGLLFECECVDLDGDVDVDLTDFAVFQTAFTGSL